MIKKSIYLLFLLYSVGQVQAQTIYFNNTYDLSGAVTTAGMGVVLTDNGYYITQFAVTNKRVIGISFIDTLGNKIWGKSYGVSGANVFTGAEAGCFAPTSDGGTILGGRNGDNPMLWKFDANGDTLWTKWYPDLNSTGICHSVRQTADNGFILAGMVDDTSGAFTSIFLKKTDSMGNMEWEQTHSNGCCGFSIDIGSDGGYIIGSMIFGSTDQQGLVVKTDSLGNFEWSREFGGPYKEQGALAAATSDGGYILAHDTIIALNPPVNDYNLIVVTKLDSSGSTQWAKTYNTGAVSNNPVIISELPDGYITTGVKYPYPASTSIGFMMKINLQGDSVWYREHTSCDSAFNVHQMTDINPTADGGFVVTGWVAGDCGPQRAWLVKTNCLGFDNPPQPEVSYNLSGTDEITFANTSMYSDSIMVSFGDGNSLITTIPSYLIDYNTSGQLIIADTIRYFTHTYADTGAYVVTITGWACGDTGVFTNTVLVSEYVGVDELERKDQVSMLRSFPNPFSEYTTIEALVPEGITHAQIIVFNTIGVEVKRFKVVEGYNAVTVFKEDIPEAGIYIYALYAASTEAAGKGQGYGKLLGRNKLIMLD